MITPIVATQPRYKHPEHVDDVYKYGHWAHGQGSWHLSHKYSGDVSQGFVSAAPVLPLYHPAAAGAGAGNQVHVVTVMDSHDSSSGNW